MIGNDFEAIQQAEKAEIIKRRKKRFKASLENGATRPKLANIISESGNEISEEFQTILNSMSEDYVEKEVKSNNDIPANHKKGETSPNPKDTESDDVMPLEDATGICLSGGGIRSGSYSLGAIQALQKFNIFQNMDYLSTVSGGGYIGASFIAADHGRRMIEQGEDEAPNSTDQKKTHMTDYNNLFQHRVGEEESVFFRYLRNNASYLKAQGIKELFLNGTVLIRGAVVNILTLAAFLTILCFLYAIALDKFGILDANDEISYFISPIMMVIFVSAAFIFMSLRGRRDYINNFARKFNKSEQKNFRKKIGILKNKMINELITYLLFLVIVAVILDVFNFVTIKIYCKLITGEPIIFSPFALLSLTSGLILPFRSKIMEALKKRTHKNVLTGLSVLIIVSLMLTCSLLSAVGLFLFRDDEISFTSLISIKEKIFTPFNWIATYIPVNEMGITSITPSGISVWFIALIAISFIVLCMSWLFMDINFSSLHRFYRDKLARAFIFYADYSEKTKEWKSVPYTSLLLSECLNKNKSERSNGMANIGPYPLINAAININNFSVSSLNGSKQQNSWDRYKKGRKADFFLFSPLYSGSRITGFTETKNIEKSSTLDLGTAIAISGAAVSASAGNRVSFFIGFLLALINARLNLWLPNPMELNRLANGKDDLRSSNLFLKIRFRPGFKYLISEMLSLNRSNKKLVNISDGGHIENIGLYQLLKRKCKFIIAVDAGCDPKLRFGDFAEALRIAQIDLGVRIDMEGLDEIRSGDQAHAVGKIHYGNDQYGQLLLLKLTLPGDKALKGTLGEQAFLSSPRREDNQMYDSFSYISAYAAKEPDFPHQSTADQFFDEEQFEAYRALGYEITMSAISKEY